MSEIIMPIIPIIIPMNTAPTSYRRVFLDQSGEGEVRGAFLLIYFMQASC
jgi:hypothetical protein